MPKSHDSRAVSLDPYLGTVSWAEQQAGIIFAIGSEVMGLDLMDHPATMRAVFPKLLRSYALDAIEAPQSATITTGEAPEFPTRIGRAEPLTRPAVGIGEDTRVTGEGISDAALWAERRYVHVCAFSIAGTGIEVRTRMSRRARRHR